MKLDCKNVSISEADGEIFQVLFSVDSDSEDGPYLLLQRAFFEEDKEDQHDPCYVETHNVNLIGHYSDLDPKLTENQLILKLPSPADDIIEVNFEISSNKFRNLKEMLSIIFR